MINFYNMRIAIFILALIGLRLSTTAQPLEMYGCHMRHQLANQRVDPEQENNLWAASVERSDSFDILDYDLTIDLRKMSQSTLSGKAVVTFTPKIAGLDYIPLDLLKLNVDSVFFEDVVAQYEYNGVLLNIHAGYDLEIGKSYRVTVQYHGVPKTSTSGFGGFYFEDGIAYNLGIGLTDDPHNFGRSWFPCFDNFVERSTYTYRVITNNDITSYSVGNLIDEQPYDDKSKIRVFRMEQQIPTYLSAIAASTYVSYEYNYNGIYGDVPVQLISKPADQSKVINAFSALGSAIDALESWYGPYPFERVGYVMTTRGAMEHPNCIAYPVTSTSGNAADRRLFSHELCHLWWGDLLTLRTQADMWIKEGNAEYGAHLFDEYLSGRASFERLVNENRYDVITTAHVSDGRYLPLSPMPKDITYGVTTYKKGAMVMHSLRGYLGDDLFRAAQQKVLQDYAYSNLTAYSYRDALSAASGVDLTDFFDRWVFDIGFYDFVISDFHKVDIPGYTHEIKIKQKLLKSNGFCKDAPVVLTFVDQDNNLSNQRVITTGEESTILLNLSFVPKAVFLNYPMALNLAQFSSLQNVKKTGNISFSFSNLSISASEVKDSTLAFMENHLTAPDPGTNSAIRVNDKHFWKFTIADPEKVSFTGKIEYNLTWDSDLLQNGEDSIQLFYRPSGIEEWSLYPFYTKKTGSLTDKKGSFLLTQFLPGEYTTGNIDPTALSNNELLASSGRIYPNPAHSEVSFSVKGFNTPLNDSYTFTLTDMLGIKRYEKLVTDGESKIRLASGLSPGIYLATVRDKGNKVLTIDKLFIE